jgi:hypothetical protein
MKNTKTLKMMRVEFENGIYCDVIPSADAPGCHDFILKKLGSGESVFMFALEVESAEKAAALVEANVSDYIEELSNDD